MLIRNFTWNSYSTVHDKCYLESPLASGAYLEQEQNLILVINEF